MARHVSQRHVSQLLHNKFVLVLGDSIQRSVYKDLVVMLQRDTYLSSSQLKTKGEISFERDCLVEGGRLGEMNNGTTYREVRQYRTDHHLVRFYFITRVFSCYMESVLNDIDNGMKPDLVIVNSCVWDVSRYSREWALEYRENLEKFFRQLKTILPKESLVVWNMTMPLGKKIMGGFLVPEIQHMGPALRFDVINANFYGATLASAYGFDVLDLHFQFRFSLHHRTHDGVHWNAVAHRKITCLLLEHVAQAWGVELSISDQHCADTRPPLLEGPFQQTVTSSDLNRYQGPFPNSDQRYFSPVEPAIHYNNGPAWRQGQRTRPYDGFGAQFFKDDLPPPFTAGFHSFHLYRGAVNPTVAPYWPVNNLVMKQRHRRPYNPYTRERPCHFYKY
ncbi:PC-esterase domain-containing protein 1A [Myxocyprinus asiaticus]|uniref:PC-esterase domain-containing protein 1A n=1 Tax=Myxocyprinus asiaticus TaxID=70543 RepID=UPI002221B5A8|nr:PC-esterase domain-containing protein 1A [Myxocyprinus asiaticus]